MPRSKSKSEHLILYTLGDPAGIGPEILVAVLNKSRFIKKAAHVVIGDLNILKDRIDRLSLDINCKVFSDFAIGSFKPGILNVINIANAKNIEPGLPSKQSGLASLEYLNKAVFVLKKYPNYITALITLPVSKRHIEMTGTNFKGHTEYLQKSFGAGSVLMVFLTSKFHLLLYTRHIPLSEVSGAINGKGLENAILQAIYFLKCNLKVKPRIAVLGLNPHAGEEGTIGIEEKKCISPLIAKLSGKGIDICGPFPADGFFRDLDNIKYDLVVSMYHDQALPLVKCCFPEAVNFSLGLPFLRFSPNYGTAFDIAGCGIAETSSLEKSIDFALKLKCR